MEHNRPRLIHKKCPRPMVVLALRACHQCKSFSASRPSGERLTSRGVVCPNCFRWIHHLARHAVACFLTRGDLWQSWEDGAAVFDDLLLDADWSVNNFNWQWLSCSAFFYQASAR